MMIRQPAVAGSFYPADALSASRLLDDCFAKAMPTDPLAAKAIVAPHAGWVFSGPVAATAYAGVALRADEITRVVLLGPAHRFAFRGIAAPSADGWQLPAGPIAIDRAGVDALVAAGAAAVMDEAFDGEHSLEVHLPFIQRVFPKAAVVPLVVGEAGAGAVSRALEVLWGGPETLIVVSSDLSHFHDYEDAGRRDLATAQVIEAARADLLSGERACGCRPLAGLLERALSLDLRITTRDLRSSGDTAGGKDRVVGYGAFSLEDAEHARLSDGDRAVLLNAARQSLAHVVVHGQPPVMETAAYSWPLRAVRKTFITLTVDGELRGCIGSMIAHAPLIDDVVGNTAKSATADPRFPPMTAQEAEHAAITISILSHARPMRIQDEADLLQQLRPHVDGVVIRSGDKSAVFLPKVWEMLPDPRVFLGHLKMKAGLDVTQPTPGLQAFRFTAETFGTD